MLKAAHLHRHAFDYAREYVRMELSVQVVGVDTADPLKDVQVAEARQKAKVASLRKIIDERHRHRKLVWLEVAGFRIDSLGIQEGSCKCGSSALVTAKRLRKATGEASQRDSLFEVRAHTSSPVAPDSCLRYTLIAGDLLRRPRPAWLALWLVRHMWIVNARCDAVGRTAK